MACTAELGLKLYGVPEGDVSFNGKKLEVFRRGYLDSGDCGAERYLTIGNDLVGRKSSYQLHFCRPTS